MGKPEVTYNTPVSLAAATDGIQVCEIPTVKPDVYIHAGERGKAPGAGGPLPLVAPSGYGFEGTAAMYPVGAGAAYSAGVVPPGIHNLIQSAGCQATGSFGAGTEKYTYSPISGPTGFTSLTVQAFFDTQQYSAAGVYSTLIISSTGPDIPLWHFDLKGTMTGIPVEATVPAIVYPPATRLPPKATNITFSLGTGTPFTTAKVKGFTFTLNRNLTQRADSNSGGHAGFTPGKRDATFEITIEQTSTASVTSAPWYTATQLNPYGLKSDRSVVGLSLNIGAVQYNRWQLNMPQAQVLTVEDFEDGNTATWKIVFLLSMSTPSSDDDFNIVFN